MGINIKKTYIRLILWTFVILWMALIFYFSSQTAPVSNKQSAQTIRTVVQVMMPSFKKLPPPKQDTLIQDLQHTARKTAHVLLYMVLGILCMSALLYVPRITKKRFLLAIIICMCYAASDEFHQVFVSGRSPLIVDVLIDTCGALAGILLLLLVRFIHGRLNLGRHSAASIN